MLMKTIPSNRLALQALIFLLLTASAAQSMPDEKQRRREGVARLHFMLGEWRTTEWLYENGRKPDQPVRGWQRVTLVLDGLFVRQEIISPVGSKTPYQGHGYLSFNPKTQQYETWYFDNDGVTVIYDGGVWRDDKTLIFTGRDATPGKVKEKRTIFTRLSAHAYELREEQDYGDGKGFVTVLEVVHRRAARPPATLKNHD
jgi:hypothetical protein